MEKEFLAAWALQEKDPDDKNIKKFFELLEEITLLLPLERDNRVLAVIGENNEKYLPVLTSENKNIPDKIASVGFSPIKFSIIKHYVLKPDTGIDGILINPLDEGILMKRKNIEFMDSLLHGMTLTRTCGIEKGMTLKVPEDISRVLREKLHHFCKKHPEIHQINYYLLKRKNDEDFHKTFFVRFDGLDTDLFPALGQFLRIFMLPGEIFELIKVENELDDLATQKATLLYMG